MAHRYTAPELVQKTVWGVELAAQRVRQAQDVPTLRRKMRLLRAKVDELEQRVMAALTEAPAGPDREG